jgi:hypothetical protein
MLENKVLRIMYGPKREEVAGGWRRLQYNEFHNLYASPSIISAMKWRRMIMLAGNGRDEICIQNFGWKI